MTPAKRRPATPASQGSKRAAPAPEEPTVANPPPVPPPPKSRDVRIPDVPTAPPATPVPDELVTAPVPPAETKDSTQLLGPDGGPIAEEAPTEDAGGGSDVPTDAGQAASEDRATTQSPARSRALYAQRVWPD